MKGLIACVAMVVPAIAIAQPPDFSWGRPGATRQAFDEGGTRCALRSARRDVSADRETGRYVRGFEVLERENNMPPMPPPPGEDEQFRRAQRQVLLRRMYQPTRQVDALQDKLQEEVAQCLRDAGYVRFALSPAQARTLRKYRPGSEARKAYLYAIGSDPRIVEAQRAR